MMKRRAFQLVVLLLMLLGGGAIVNVAVAWGVGICLGNHHEPSEAPPHKFMVSYAFREYQGWPVQALAAGHDSRAVIDTGRYRLLLAIVWPGFAINTIFYAAVLWVVFFVPGMVRRRIRRRRGLCPACAYPIGSSPVCTECGETLG